MKALMFVFGVALFVGCASVDLTERSNVIDLPGQTKQQIYEKSRQWLTYKFISGRAVMDYSEQSMGRIIAKGSLLLGNIMGSSMYVYLIGTIDSINGKAKISIIPAGCQVGTTRGNIDCPCNGMYLTPSALSGIPEEIDKFIADYKAYMNGGRAPAWDGR